MYDGAGVNGRKNNFHRFPEKQRKQSYFFVSDVHSCTIVGKGGGGGSAIIFIVTYLI